MTPERAALLQRIRTGGLSSPMPSPRRRSLKTEVLEALRQENKRITEENRVLRQQLDRLETRAFSHELQQKVITHLYQATRLLLRVAPKTKRAKLALQEVRGLFVDLGVKPPSELRRPRKPKPS